MSRSVLGKLQMLEDSNWRGSPSASVVSCSTLSFFGSLFDHAWSSHVPVSCKSSGLSSSRTRFGRPSSSEAGGAWDHGRLVSPRGPVSRFLRRLCCRNHTALCSPPFFLYYCLRAHARKLGRAFIFTFTLHTLYYAHTAPCTHPPIHTVCARAAL